MISKDVVFLLISMFKEARYDTLRILIYIINDSVLKFTQDCRIGWKCLFLPSAHNTYIPI